MPKKPKAKPRRWRCVSFSKSKRCQYHALIQTQHLVGTPEFNFYVKLNMCLPCSRKFSLAIRGLSV